MRQTTCIAGILVSLLAGACLAEAVELPVERFLEARRIELDLRDSQVDLIITSDQDARISIVDLVHGEDTTGFVLLEDADSGTLRVGQPHGDGEIAPSLALEIIIPPGRQFFIEGHKINLVIRDLRGELQAADRELILESAGLERSKLASPGGIADNLRIEVDDSDVTLSGVVGAKISGTGSRYTLESCRGPILFDLDNATCEISRHWGSLHVGGQDSEFRIEGGDQAVDYRLQRGSLSVFQAMGDFRGESVEATLFLEQWDGDLNIAGERSHIEILHSGHDESLTSLRGSDHEIRLEDLRGSLSMDLAGGTVAAEHLEGAVAARGEEGTRFELKNLGDDLEVQLTRSSYALIEGVAKDVKIELQEAELQIKDVAELGGRASNSTVRASEVAGRMKLVATDADLDLDLSESSSSKLSLELKGECQARVALRDPCLIQPKASQQARQEISITGCEMIEPGTRRPPIRRVAGRPAPTTLDVALEDGSELEVWSR